MSVKETLSQIKWSYRWNQIKDRIFYIIGFLALIFMQELSRIWIIGDIYTDLQAMSVLPSDDGIARTFTFAIILAIFVASWDLLSGYSGQVSFGHALFFGLGAYSTALLKTGFEIELPGLKFERSDTFGYKIIFHFFPYRHSGYNNNVKEIAGIFVNFGFIEALLVSALFVTFVSIIIGILTLRSKGSYFALITLVLPIIFAELFKIDQLKDITGGAEGGVIFPDSQRLVPITSETGYDGFTIIPVQFKVILFIAIISIAIIYFIAKSRIGIVFQAIREDELATSASGINVNFYKLLAFAISSFFAAIAGGLALLEFRSATISIFDPEKSFEPIIFSIVGGIGTITGAVVATLFLRPAIDLFINKAFIESPTINTLALAVLLIFILRFQPRGLVRAKKRVRNAIFIAFAWTISLFFYDAGDGYLIDSTLLLGRVNLKRVDVPNDSILGRFFSRVQWFKSPEEFLIDHFMDSGLFSINVATIEGRVLLYFLVGMILGYFGPEFFQKIRLKVWGVWPSLGKYDPPT